MSVSTQRMAARGESVPNISEGRDERLIERLIADSSVPGVLLADVHSDSDHHRTVLTWFGPPPDLVKAALELCSSALRWLDISRHQGVHPRVGLVDVLPFVPLGSMTMATVVWAAREAASRIGRELGIPTLLYGAAATTPERRQLAAHRRGGLEGLAARMASGEWPPDFGPPTPHPRAGVTLVGARSPLVAFNAILDTANLEIATAIASAVREGGTRGLPGLRALGLTLSSRRLAQVSMNVTAPERTPLAAVLGAVEHEAERHGARVSSTELVGLAPAAAIAGCTAQDLKLPALGPEQLIEHYLYLE